MTLSDLPMSRGIPYLRQSNSNHVKARILYLVIIALLPFPGQGQTTPRSYFVVVGAFAKIDNAVRYTAMANKNNFSAQYAINPARKLYYVYLFNTHDHKKAFAFMIKMRAETEYKDAWVFIGQLGEQAVSGIEKPPEKPVDPLVDVKPAEVKKDSAQLQAVVDSSTFKKPELPEPVVPKPVVKKPDGKAF